MASLTVDTALSQASAPVAAPTLGPAETSASPRTYRTHTRSPSPGAPPMSPITPPPASPSNTTTAAATDFAATRQTYTHTTHPTNVASSTASPPPPAPIDFATNPDVLALKSAISILQIQKARAEADMRALSKVKDDAVARPEEFVGDLLAGKVGSGGGGSVPKRRKVDKTEQGDERDGEESDDDEDADDNNNDTTAISERSWATLPKPQNIVRCPPINWSQYAVAGESLNKLHQEQLTRPTLGVPATLKPDGTYEIQAGVGGANPADGKQLLGVAAPYKPGRDRIEGGAGRGGKKVM